MIKLSRVVKNTVKEMQEQVGDTYIYGTCVIDSLQGRDFLDWEIAAKCDEGEEVKALFPIAESVEFEGEKRLRLDMTESEDDAENPIIDVSILSGNIEEFLGNRDFTINAMAEDSAGNLIDPYGGRADMEEGLIRSVGDAAELFDRKPVSLIRAVRLAAEYNFDIERKTYNAIVTKSGNLSKVDKKLIREELDMILTSPNAGKGLRMLAGGDLMPYIIGEYAVNLNARQRNQFSTLCDNIDETQPVVLRRLGLLYSSLDEKKGKSAINNLIFSEEEKQHLMDGLFLMHRMQFLRNMTELKDFMGEIGKSRYEYIDNLSKAQRIVYGGNNHKIMSRYYMLKEIQSRQEPIFIEDLAIDREYIMEKLDVNAERADELLHSVLDMVHRKPAENNEEDLLKHAKKFKNSKFAEKTRRIKWMR